MERLAVMQLAPADGRSLSRFGGPNRDKALAWLAIQASRRAHFLELVAHGGTLDSEEQGMVLARGCRRAEDPVSPI